MTNVDIWGFAQHWSKSSWIVALVISVIAAFVFSATLGELQRYLGINLPTVLRWIAVAILFYPSYYCVVRIYALGDANDKED